MSTNLNLPNLLLAALSTADQDRMQTLLESVELPAGTMLYEAGSPLGQVYFPTSAVVSLTSTMQDGASAEIAVVGREGVVGICAFMGGGDSLSSAMVQRAGQAWRMRARRVDEAVHSLDTLMPAVLRYTQVLFAQIAQTSACCRHHALEQQLCRWLLSHLDRAPGDEMMLTQERIALMLGVRREGITTHAQRLQKAGLIRCGRGRIEVIDRTGLEQRCCECYAVLRGAYDQLNAATAPRAQGLPRRACAVTRHEDFVSPATA